MAKSIACAALLCVAVLAGSQTTRAAEPTIDELTIATTTPEAASKAMVAAATAFYRFWNTGDEASLRSAIAPTFTDHTLPPGRPQGPEGPAFASRTFRQAVPDLSVEVKKMIVAGTYVTVHMIFKGHFTGTFGSMQGKGQSIDFIATDLIRITDGRITDNWHIEDNLTLLQKMGVATIAH